MVENYTVCNCKQVSYADIANALDTHTLAELLQLNYILLLYDLQE